MTTTAQTIQDALRAGMQHHQAGRLHDAELHYRRVLQLNPQNPDALHLLGMIAQSAGQFPLAIDLMSRAVSLQPSTPHFHNNLGNAFRDAGRLDEAASSYTRATQIDPHYAMAFSNLGNVLRELRRLPESLAACQRAVQLNPNYADAHSNLGNTLLDLRRPAQAVAAYEVAVRLAPDFAEAFTNLSDAYRVVGRLNDAVNAARTALRLRPDLAHAHNHLGNALREQGQLDQAIAAYDACIAAAPNFAPAYNNLATALREQGHVGKAIALYRRCIELDPTDAEAHNNLGIALQFSGDPDAAIEQFNRALEMRPDFAEVYSNLGNTLRDQGKIDEAIVALRKAAALLPDLPRAQSNYLFALNYLPGADGVFVLDEHRKWAARCADSLAAPPSIFINDRTPDRRVRIGYLSPDLYAHAVGRFLVPLFESHDHTQFEIITYADNLKSDAITEKLRAACDRWEPVQHLVDADLAEKIRSDRIDILIDLALHTNRNRTMVFARRAAPIQATYLAYPGTSGLATMDFRITDGFLDPADRAADYYTETSIRIPSYWCYRPPPDAPDRPSHQANDFITFGCLNNFSKVSAPALSTWAAILRAVPNSRLLLYAHAGSHRARIDAPLAAENISLDRVEFVGKQSIADYMKTYSRIDIAVDPFPYAGGTTTCDALYMACPVITLAGQTAVQRAGVSILSNVGLPQLIASSRDDYIRIASELATDRARLAGLRARLPEQMSTSPLCDAIAFTRAIESTYRAMWQRFTAGAK